LVPSASTKFFESFNEKTKTQRIFVFINNLALLFSCYHSVAFFAVIGDYKSAISASTQIHHNFS
jgi:hypothetical protein